MENIEFGFWTLEEDGIGCSLWIHRNSFIGNGYLNCVERTNSGPVWDYPVHFARKSWATPEIIQTLITALATKRILLGMEQQPEIDARTWAKVSEILNENQNAV